MSKPLSSANMNLHRGSFVTRWMGLCTARLLVLAMFVVPALGCSEGYGSTPADQLQPVTDELQTSAQYAAYQVLSPFHNLQDGVAGPFSRTAAINLDYHDTNDNLPPPYDSNRYPDWPNADSFPNVYEAYAETYHDTLNYRWVVFYVNHLGTNRTDTCGSIQTGASNPFPGGVPNTVPAASKQRHSFVFVTDIQVYEQISCSPPTCPRCTPATDQQLENEMIHLVAHEYGHQRAGLTDGNPSTHGLYHSGPVPLGREDVMTRPPNYSELWYHTDPVFDSWGNERSGDHSTCRGNLVTNQLVH